MKKLMVLGVSWLLLLFSLAPLENAKENPLKENNCNSELKSGDAPILIFAPHPDDEALGCAGIINNALKNNKHVEIIVLTNGEAYEYAFLNWRDKTDMDKDGDIDFIDFGYKRQQETITAMQILGLSPENIIFLGYPDGGLDNLLTENWVNPYFSPYTGTNYSPYKNSYTPCVRYSGEQLLEDIKEIIETFKPMEIYVTSRFDTHPDHKAANLFVRKAVQYFKLNGYEWSKHIKVYSYIIHAGEDWPSPEGYYPNKNLLPPTTLNDELADVIHLDNEAKQLKYQAILAYETQIEVDEQYLLSFVRNNELFWLERFIYKKPEKLTVKQSMMRRNATDLGKECAIGSYPQPDVWVYFDLDQDGTYETVLESIDSLESGIYQACVALWNDGETGYGGINIEIWKDNVEDPNAPAVIDWAYEYDFNSDYWIGPPGCSDESVDAPAYFKYTYAYPDADSDADPIFRYSLSCGTPISRSDAHGFEVFTDVISSSYSPYLCLFNVDFSDSGTYYICYRSWICDNDDTVWNSWYSKYDPYIARDPDDYHYNRHHAWYDPDASDGGDPYFDIGEYNYYVHAIDIIDVWIYNLWIENAIDQDGDGYYRSFDLYVDADTNVDSIEVWASLSLAGVCTSPWTIYDAEYDAHHLWSYNADDYCSSPTTITEIVDLYYSNTCYDSQSISVSIEPASDDIPLGTMNVNPTTWNPTIQCGESDSKTITVSANGGTVYGITVSKISGPSWISASPTDLGDISSGSSKTFTITASPPSGTNGDFSFKFRVSCSQGNPSYIDVTGTIHVTCIPPKWTIMVYMDGDNDLEEAGIMDINEMEEVGSTNEVKIIVQFDRIDGYDGSNGDWTTTRRYYIEHDSDPYIISSTLISDLGECNMGNPATLSDFIIWTIQNYPAEHYALIIWDHGSGWRNINNKSCCEDVTDGDELTLAEIRTALNTAYIQTGKKLDIIGFDACLMGMLEVAYEIREYGYYMVASEEREPFEGWVYDASLSALINNPDMSASQFAQQIINDYVSDSTNTLSAPELNLIESVASAASSFANLLYNDLDNSMYRAIIETCRDNSQEYFSHTPNDPYGDYYYIDLYDFAQRINSESMLPAATRNAANALMIAINDCIGGREAHGSARPGSHGLSIYFPGSDDIYAPSYGETLFAETYSWDEFLQKYKGLMDIIPPIITNVQVTPAIQIAGGWVNITCEVTDNIAVNTVKVNITCPAGCNFNVTMNNIPGTNIYYYNSTYSIIGTWYFFIWANDTSGNTNLSNIHSFITHTSIYELVFSEDFNKDLTENWYLIVYNSAGGSENDAPPQLDHDMGLPSPSLDPNGDSWCGNAIYSKQTFDYTDGLIIEFDMYVASGYDWNWGTGGLADHLPNLENKRDDGAYIDNTRCDPRYLAAIKLIDDNHYNQAPPYLVFCVKTEDGDIETYRYLEDATSYENEWHNYRIEILPDGYVKFYIDGSFIWKSTKKINKSYGQMPVLFGCRDVSGPVRIDNIKVYKSILYNNPPLKPQLLSPQNNSSNVPLNPTLCAYVIDPDDDAIDVYFYDAKDPENLTDDVLIGVVSNVSSASYACITWNGLEEGETYYWYVIANDSQHETASDIYCFTTRSGVPTIPHIIWGIIKENGSGINDANIVLINN